jgi:exodeoxyribonuclease VII large subunit
VAAYGDRLDALSPLRVLARGYAIALRRDGRAVRSAGEVKPGEALTLKLGQDSELEATVTRVKPGEK